MVKVKSKRSGPLSVAVVVAVAVGVAVAVAVATIAYFAFQRSSSQCPPNMICTPASASSQLLVSPPPSSHVSASSRDRDAKVLSDPLYPPLNRSDTITHNSLETAAKRRDMYVATNDTRDEYRLVGYMVNNDASQKDMGGNSWKLFAREKDRNTSDFYMIPSNNNYDVKIPVNDDMVKGSYKVRDVYNIPKEVEFDSPMLNDSPYTFVQLPKADFTTSSTYV